MCGMVGKGSCASVLLARRDKDDRRYAAKVLPRRPLKNAKVLRPEMEIELHRVCSDHEHIVTLESVASDTDHHYLFQHLASRGDLYDKLISIPSERLPEVEVVRLMRQLLAALAHMHAKGVAHRDIKIENILLDTVNEDVRLCDFGFATREKKCNEACGTLDYAAPEVLLAKRNSYDPTKSDVWSAGVVMFVLLTGLYPFEGRTNQETRINILERDPVRSKHIQRAQKLCERMLNKAPSNRPTAAECLQDPFITPLVVSG